MFVSHGWVLQAGTRTFYCNKHPQNANQANKKKTLQGEPTLYP